MYQTMYLDQRVSLTPVELNILTDAASIQNLLETKLRETYEGRCNANGYVRPGSIKLLGRSMGCAENGRFTGNMIYDCKISCEVLHPTVGSEVEVRVIKVNRMGAYAVFEEAIRVLLPRDIHLGSAEFDAIEEGDTVRAVLDRSRFQTNDTFIMAVGHLAATDAA
jgi:DNA-directed RNA polymerase subunit E'/Rpb7